MSEGLLSGPFYLFLSVYHTSYGKRCRACWELYVQFGNSNGVAIPLVPLLAWIGWGWVLWRWVW